MFVSDVLVCDDVANVCDVANVTCNLFKFKIFGHKMDNDRGKPQLLTLT